MTMHFLLIGLRGSGKTTLGRALARRLGWVFVDLDDVTPGILGEKTVAAAWRRHGEPGFRVAEAAALRRVLERTEPAVVALGGGTPTAPGAADSIRKAKAVLRARVIYLHAGAAALRERLSRADNPNRPSLTGADPLDEIDVVLARRDPLFREIADWVVDVEGLDEAEAAQVLDAAITKLGNGE